MIITIAAFIAGAVVAVVSPKAYVFVAKQIASAKAKGAAVVAKVEAKV